MRSIFVALLAGAVQSAGPPVGKGPLLLQETFELTAPGDIPRGFQKTGAAEVVEGVAFSGRRSLRIAPAPNGPRRITLRGDVLRRLGGRHWGRLFFKVQLPHPEPAAGVIHSTLVAGAARSPLDQQPIEVRLVDTVLGAGRKHQWLYNVQPASRPEFGKGSGFNYWYSDQWTLAEWYVDFDTQSFRLFIDGKEIEEVAFSKGKGNFRDAEIPEVFESLSFGWNNYQQAGAGFTAWIDDIALAPERIGTRGVVPSRKKN